MASFTAYISNPNLKFNPQLMYRSIKENNLSAVKQLVKRFGKGVISKKTELPFGTFLSYAISEKKLRMVKYLASQGRTSDLNFKDKKHLNLDPVMLSKHYMFYGGPESEKIFEYLSKLYKTKKQNAEHLRLQSIIPVYLRQKSRVQSPTRISQPILHRIAPRFFEKRKQLPILPPDIYSVVSDFLVGVPETYTGKATIRRRVENIRTERLRDQARKLKVKLTVASGNKRKYKSDSTLSTQIGNAKRRKN
jgi:hypothetical protein